MKQKPFIIKYCKLIGSLFFIQFIIDILKNIYETDINNFFMKILNYSSFISLIIIILTYLLFRENNNHYRDIISNLELDLNDDSRKLFSKYHDLKIYKEKELLDKVLASFVSNQNKVLSIQIYEFKELINKNYIKIKVNHFASYVQEGEILNAILQEYFILPKNEYLNFLSFKNNKKNIKKERLEFFLKSKTKLEESLKNPINDELASLYFLTRINYELLLKDTFSKNSITTENILNNEIFENKLRNYKKRIGILNGILANKLYWNENNESNSFEKKGRIYLTSPFKFNKKNVIMLISVHKGLINKEQDYINIFEDFKSEISDYFKNVKF